LNSKLGTTANAASATKLATARTINGVSFDGSANITINAADSTARIASSEKGANNGVATLDAAGKVPAAQLPSYVDDVIEAANLAAFPTTGEAGKIYVAINTNKTYRWSGSAYVYITSGAVDSVAGKTGVVTLTKADVGLSNVDNTTDLAKPISTATQTALNTKLGTTANAASATKLATARTIGGVSFNGTANINLPGVNVAGNQNTTGNASTATWADTVDVNGSNTSGTWYDAVWHSGDTLYSSTGVEIQGSTNSLRATNLEAREKVKLGTSQEANISYNSTSKSLDFNFA
jgi:hypothetical protein